jgi:hypothetical protein
MRGLRNDRTGGGGRADKEPASYWCLNVPTHPHQNDKKDSTPSEYENRREKGEGRGGEGGGALASVELGGGVGEVQVSGNLGLAVIPQVEWLGLPSMSSRLRILVLWCSSCAIELSTHSDQA